MSTRLVFFVLALSFAMLACSLSSDSTGGGGAISTDPAPAATAEPAATATPSGPKVLLNEDFSQDDVWSTFTSDNGAVSYDAGQYVLATKRSQWFVWGQPESEPTFSDVIIEATVKNTGDADDAGFGLMCNYEDDTHYYYAGVAPDGYLAVVKADGDTEKVLSSDTDQWESSDSVPVNASSYKIGLECANGRVALYLNKEEIFSAQDKTFTEGQVGVFLQSFDKSDAEVHFDNLTITEVK